MCNHGNNIKYCLCHLVMVEGSGKEVSEDVVCEAVALAGKTVEPFLEALSEFQIKHGKRKREFKAFLASEEVYSIIKRYYNVCGRGEGGVLSYQYSPSLFYAACKGHRSVVTTVLCYCEVQPGAVQHVL